MSNRDDFTKKTIDILARRVGFLCSNPKCRIHTVGPNTNEDKTTIVGIAAHISAASAGGPRYNPNISSDRRKHISNGIWLCATCSTLIDKDPSVYPESLLLDWKDQAEEEMRQNLQGGVKDSSNGARPFLEADLIWSNSIRSNMGYSEKNKELYGDHVIVGKQKPIIFWDLCWRFSFLIHNNSTQPAFNVRLEPVGDVLFSQITKLNKINNIPPYQNVDLNTQYLDFLEGTSTEADELLRKPIPDELNGLKMQIIYNDESGKEHNTIFEIVNNDIVNHRA